MTFSSDSYNTFSLTNISPFATLSYPTSLSDTSSFGNPTCCSAQLFYRTFLPSTTLSVLSCHIMSPLIFSLSRFTLSCLVLLSSSSSLIFSHLLLSHLRLLISFYLISFHFVLSFHHETGIGTCPRTILRSHRATTG